MGQDFLEVLGAQDVSVSGLAVRVPHGFEGCDIASTVELVIKLPGSASFSASGVIRHRSGSLFGVEFKRLSNDALKVLERFIEAGVRAGRVAQ